jgi:Flp pilus assembly protein TadB
MTTWADQILIAGCGAGVGAGVYLFWRAARPSATSLAADLDALYASPTHTGSTDRSARAAGRWVTDALQRAGLQRVLLIDQLAVADRPLEAHTTARLLHAATGTVIALALWAVAAALTPVGVLLAPLAVVFGGIAGVWVADRRVRAVAESRRREAQLAVAAYLDLVRILLVGGLPLLAALRAAADSGDGWAFDQLRQALAWAHDRGLPPDEGLRELGERITVPEFADLALTIASARRGASPIQALESKAAFMRGAHSAQARAEAAIADAQIELPAAAVALAFMFFLTYPLMTLITTGTGVLP